MNLLKIIMVIIMNTNKITIISSVIIIILILAIPTTYKVIKIHNQNLYKVVEDKIIEKAKECYYDKKCVNEKITLEELYEYKYLDIVSDPITKEEYNKLSYVEKKDDKYKFVVVE